MSAGNPTKKFMFMLFLLPWQLPCYCVLSWTSQGKSLVWTTSPSSLHSPPPPPLEWTVVAHDCGYPLSRYTCRATRVAADFLDFRAFCRCSTGVALHPLEILVSHLSPPPFPGGVAPKLGSEKVSRYRGVSQLQLRVSRYTVQLRNGQPTSVT